MDTAVWDIPDLVRYIGTQCSTATALFFVSRGIKENEPCAASYREWAQTGCPNEHPCLASVRDTPLCMGRLFVTMVSQGLLEQEETLQEVMDRLGTIMNGQLGMVRMRCTSELRVDIRFAATVLRMLVDEKGIRLMLTQNGWRHRGPHCELTREDALAFLRQVLGSYGRMATPCDDATSSYAALQVTRELRMNVTIYDFWHETQWMLLSVIRK